MESFDNELFGLLIRRARRNYGLGTFEDFSNAIADLTNCEIGPSTIQRIESGKQEIKLGQLMAICSTLSQLEEAREGTPTKSGFSGYFSILEDEIDMCAAPTIRRKYEDRRRLIREQEEATMFMRH